MAIENLMLDSSNLAESAVGGGLAAFAVVAIVFGLIFALAIYIYMSYVYMIIARKAKYPSPAIAWIPIVGPSLISAKLAGMHWWPVLLLLATPIPFLGQLAGLVFMVFLIVWTWKMFEGFGRPGWWAIFWLINIVEMVFLGIVAWSDNKYNPKKARKR